MTFTIFGAGGFVGSHLLAALQSRAADCLAPSRNDFDSWVGRDLGHVIYAIGITADFRSRPIDTVRAHVARLADVLERARYQSFVYLSSTRVYAGADLASEETTIRVDPCSMSDLYNLSKLMGESLVHAVAGDRARVARLSNVYGADWSSDNFVVSLIRDAVRDRAVVIRTSSDSAKDYVSVDDTVRLLIDIATRGTRGVYNVASGNAITNAAIATALRRASDCTVAFEVGAPAVRFPLIDVTRIREEFGLPSRSLIDDLPSLVADYQRTLVA